jgi:hypothetical protein
MKFLRDPAVLFSLIIAAVGVPFLIASVLGRFSVAVTKPL